ncbi:S8 family serine peptidase, partial [Streptomyces massasporeus]
HKDFGGRAASGFDAVDNDETADDRNGHGTHVASTVGGSGAGSDGKEKGVAPGATLAVGKVLDDEGSGSESEIIAGMEWAAKDIDAKIVSMSLGSPVPTDCTDPMAQAVNTLTAETGALFVIAAGNSGAPGSIGSPGAADSALTIGAVDSADEAAYFTSQGPRYGDQALKPDLSAPGVGILAARSQLVSGSGLYTSMSGTSMATPHVAGVAALLAERHPDWTGAQLKTALMSSSKTLDASSYALGSGRVDVAAAITANVTATGSADLGFFAWPYEANKPVTKTVTYTNSSDTPVALNLAVEGMPAGVAALADTTLTVPAHGTASTTVTGDGAKAPVGQSSGRVTATAAGTVVAHTALGLVKEEERYTLTVHVKDRDGAATPAYLGVQQLTRGVDPFPATVGESGTLELRLKPGTYTVDTFLDVRGSHGKDSLGLGFLTAPEITLDRDRAGPVVGPGLVAGGSPWNRTPERTERMRAPRTRAGKAGGETGSETGGEMRARRGARGENEVGLTDGRRYGPEHVLSRARHPPRSRLVRRHRRRSAAHRHGPPRPRVPRPGAARRVLARSRARRRVRHRGDRRRARPRPAAERRARPAAARRRTRRRGRRVHGPRARARRAPRGARRPRAARRRRARRRARRAARAPHQPRPRAGRDPGDEHGVGADLRHLGRRSRPRHRPGARRRPRRTPAAHGGPAGSVGRRAVDAPARLAAGGQGGRRVDATGAAPGLAGVRPGGGRSDAARA